MSTMSYQTIGYIHILCCADEYTEPFCNNIPTPIPTNQTYEVGTGISKQFYWDLRLRICFNKRNLMNTFTIYCSRDKQRKTELRIFRLWDRFMFQAFLPLLFYVHIFRQHNIHDWQVQYHFPAIRLTKTNDPEFQDLHPHAADPHWFMC